MLSFVQKRDDFHTYLTALLQVHDSAFAVDVLERREFLLGLSRESRVRVTGNPVRYATIMDLGQTTASAEGFEADDDVLDYVGHRFEVQIFWDVAFATTYAASSQKLFEEMAYNASGDASPGILQSIRENRQRTVSSDVYQFGLSQEDAVIDVVRGIWDFGDIGQSELSHYLKFEIILV